MRVRIATPADAADVLALDPDADPTDLRHRLAAEQLCAGALGWFLVADSGPGAVGPGLAGHALVRPRHLLGLDELTDLRVATSLRRNGIGRALVAAAVAAATTPQVLAAVPRRAVPVRALLAGADWDVGGRVEGVADGDVVILRTSNRPAPPAGRLYHLALREDWDRATRSGAYRVSTLGATLDRIGFIHLSFGRQVAGVAAAYYGGLAAPVVLLTVDRARLRARVAVEEVPGADDLFPHLYGPLPCDAVSAVTPLARDGAGRLVLPDLDDAPR